MSKCLQSWNRRIHDIRLGLPGAFLVVKCIDMCGILAGCSFCFFLWVLLKRDVLGGLESKA